MVDFPSLEMGIVMSCFFCFMLAKEVSRCMVSNMASVTWMFRKSAIRRTSFLKFCKHKEMKHNFTFKQEKKVILFVYLFGAG